MWMLLFCRCFGNLLKSPIESSRRIFCITFFCHIIMECICFVIKTVGWSFFFCSPSFSKIGSIRSMNFVQCARYYKQRRWFFIIARCRKQVVLERPPHIFITINFIRTNAKTFGRLMIQWCFFLSIVGSRKICYNFIFSPTINLHQCAFPKNYYLSYWGRIFTALTEINKKILSNKTTYGNDKPQKYRRPELFTTYVWNVLDSKRIQRQRKVKFHRVRAWQSYAFAFHDLDRQRHQFDST